MIDWKNVKDIGSVMNFLFFILSNDCSQINEWFREGDIASHIDNVLLNFNSLYLLYKFGYFNDFS